MQRLLVLNIDPKLEEDLVDFLLSFDDLNGFTSFTTNGHGEHSQFSLAEQVAGRQKRIQFQVIANQEVFDHLLPQLREQVGANIFYWLQDIYNVNRT